MRLQVAERIDWVGSDSLACACTSQARPTDAAAEAQEQQQQWRWENSPVNNKQTAERNTATTAVVAVETGCRRRREENAEWLGLVM